MNWAEGVRNRSYRIHLPPHEIASRQARRILDWALRDWGVDGDTADSAHVVLSELVTNAGAYSREVFHLALHLHGDRIRLEVWDRADDSPRVMPPSDDAVDGRGMFLVEALCEEWGVRREKAGGKTVWATVTRPNRCHRDPDQPVHPLTRKAP